MLAALASHRLAWLYMTGEWPKGDLDHANMNKADNRWCNLREATNAQNGANRGIPTNNKSGFRGVSWAKRHRKWTAHIRAGRKQYTLGYYNAREEAALTYATYACGLFGEFANPTWRDVLADIRGAVT